MKCHGCGAEIRPEHEHFGNPEQIDPSRFQGDAALHLRITGGHGEFFDTITGSVDLIFCHDCGHKIFSLFPHLVERFRGAHSLRADVPMVDAMCWGLEPRKSPDEEHVVIYGDGKREARA